MQTTFLPFRSHFWVTRWLLIGSKRSNSRQEKKHSYKFGSLPELTDGKLFFNCLRPFDEFQCYFLSTIKIRTHSRPTQATTICMLICSPSPKAASKCFHDYNLYLDDLSWREESFSSFKITCCGFRRRLRLIQNQQFHYSKLNICCLLSPFITCRLIASRLFNCRLCVCKLAFGQRRHQMNKLPIIKVSGCW